MSPDADDPTRFPPHPDRPRLLVSVRSVDEARAAIAGGCEVLDIKEPEHGSLGMARVETIAAITEARATIAPEMPLSAALGETTDWLDAETFPRLPAELDFTKLGTAGLADRANGLDDWLALRRRFDAANNRPLNWIAVGYADWQRAAAPKPGAVLRAAVESGCAGLLIDTFVKDGRSLLEWMSLAELREFRELVSRRKLLFAVAGSLKLEQIAEVQSCRPDVVAVRTAACDRGARTGAVTESATRRLWEVMKGGCESGKRRAESGERE